MTTTADNPIFQIERQYGQSIWMDNLSRDIIQSGELKQLLAERGVRGITSNPAIFEKAIAGNQTYDADIEAGIRDGKSVQEIYEALVFADIRAACDVLRPVYDETNGLDGYVSIEVPPDIALDAQRSTAEAQRYYEAIARENVMIKIPGTPEGLVAVEDTIAAGINVNVTLLFSVQSYVDTAWAYIRGLERRVEAGQDISKLASVASFFLSRIDVKVDAALEDKLKGTDDEAESAKLTALLGKTAIANAKVAYQKFKEIFGSDRWKALESKGAHVQRLLWASTGTKNPKYSDVMYVDELVGNNTVNTLPPNTLEACADHCSPGARIETDVRAAENALASLGSPDVGIDLDAVMAELLEEGIEKFIKPYNSLMDSLQTKVDKLAAV